MEQVMWPLVAPEKTWGGGKLWMVSVGENNVGIGSWGITLGLLGEIYVVGTVSCVV